MNELIKRDTGEIIQNQVLSPVNLDLVVESFQAYQLACTKLLIDSDYQMIQGKKFKKKSAWRKLATAYCISTEIREERREDLASGNFVYHFKVRAIANNGRYAEGVGSCSSDEKGLAKTEHNTRSIAETRATNRAISNLIGAGEVSAEEIDPNELHKNNEEVQLNDFHKIQQAGEDTLKEKAFPSWEWMMDKPELFLKRNGKSAYKKDGISKAQLNRFQIMFHQADFQLADVQAICEDKQFPVDLTELTYKQLEELENILGLKKEVNS